MMQLTGLVELPLLLLLLMSSYPDKCLVQSSVLKEVPFPLHSNASLPCDALTLSLTAGEEYRSLTWYRLNHPTREEMSGLLQERNGSIKYYRYPRPAGFSLGGEGHLELANVTAGDSGVYQCLLRANLGGRNRHSEIYLCVDGCPDKPVGGDEEEESVMSQRSSPMRAPSSEDPAPPQSYAASSDSSTTVTVAVVSGLLIALIAAVGLYVYRRRTPPKGSKKVPPL